MRPILLAAAAFLGTTFAQAAPPREESPAPAHLVRAEIGESDAELEALVAAADRSPLGSLTNPVRVGGPDGERAYLARLRCADGAAPRIGPRGEGGAGGFGSVTGSFVLECPAGPLTVITDIYHEGHVETRAPNGLVLTR